jgi:hypothetical protein
MQAKIRLFSHFLNQEPVFPRGEAWEDEPEKPL